MSWLFQSNAPYIKDHQKDLVRAHKYQGQCLSYSYKLFYSPLCDILVKILPGWIAPNMISFLGFLLNLIPHILIVILFDGNLGGPLPAWFLIGLGISFFSYMVCDNSDGKQARKNGTSSPLGMLLDHGIDCVTTVINNFILQRIVNIGNGYFCIVGMLCSTIPFYYATLEQYYTGELVLQVVNGVDDGSIVYVLVCFLTAYLGSDTWTKEFSFLGFPPTTFPVMLIWILMITQVLSSIENFRGIYNKRDSKQFQVMFKPLSFIAHSVWYIINAAIFLVAAYYSPQNIMDTHPRRVMYAFGFQFILVNLRLQVSHVIHDVFNPFRRTCILTWAILVSHTIFVILFNQSLMNEALMYLIIDIYSFLSIAHLVYYYITELKTILNINLLTLTKEQLANLNKPQQKLKDH